MDEKFFKKYLITILCLVRTNVVACYGDVSNARHQFMALKFLHAYNVKVGVCTYVCVCVTRKI